jgi:hypothetical protein
MKCKTAGCDKIHYAHGFCRYHYRLVPEVHARIIASRRTPKALARKRELYAEWRKTHPALKQRGPAAITRLCSVKGCGGKHISRGFCKVHYELERSHRDFSEEIHDKAIKIGLSPETARAFVMDGEVLESRLVELRYTMLNQVKTSSALGKPRDHSWRTKQRMRPCGSCGKRFITLYPNRGSRILPKPGISEHNKYCLWCWRDICKKKGVFTKKAARI